jgi:hypothetical protein
MLLTEGKTALVASYFLWRVVIPSRSTLLDTNFISPAGEFP